MSAALRHCPEHGLCHHSSRLQKHTTRFRPQVSHHYRVFLSLFLIAYPTSPGLIQIQHYGLHSAIRTGSTSRSKASCCTSQPASNTIRPAVCHSGVLHPVFPLRHGPPDSRHVFETGCPPRRAIIWSVPTQLHVQSHSDAYIWFCRYASAPISRAETTFSTDQYAHGRTQEYVSLSR